MKVLLRDLIEVGLSERTVRTYASFSSSQGNSYALVDKLPKEDVRLIEAAESRLERLQYSTGRTACLHPASFEAISWHERKAGHGMCSDRFHVDYIGHFADTCAKAQKSAGSKLSAPELIVTMSDQSTPQPTGYTNARLLEDVLLGRGGQPALVTATGFINMSDASYVATNDEDLRRRLREPTWGAPSVTAINPGASRTSRCLPRRGLR